MMVNNKINFSAVAVLALFGIVAANFAFGATNADLVLSPASQTVVVNSNFNVDIMMQTNGEQVAGMQVYLNFDPSKLAVNSITMATTWNGNQVTSLENTFDNINGRIGIAGVTLGTTTSGNFTVATINFLAEAAAINSGITFNFDSNTGIRDTQAQDMNTNSILNAATGAAITAVVTRNADLVLLPASQTVAPNSSFGVDIQVQSNGESVNAVASYIDFNPAYLRVQSFTPAANWGGNATAVLENTVDNVAGRINFAGGLLGQTASGNFNIATINFMTRATAGNTNINFHFAPPIQRNTDVLSGGNSVLNSTVGVAVLISPVCETSGDDDHDGRINNLEISSHVHRWKSGSVPNLEILKTVRFWKSGDGC